MDNISKDQDRVNAYKMQADDNARFYESMDKAAKDSEADRTFFEAAKRARSSVIADKLEPVWIDYEWVHTAEQGAKAACFNREDIVAITNIQHSVLKRLDRNRNFMWIIIALLVYIASKFS